MSQWLAPLMHLDSKLILVVVAVCIVAAWWLLRHRNLAARSARAHAAVQAGARIVDVRTPEEFQAGHIEGAVNIPVVDLGRRMSEVGSKKQAVVVYCRSGARSASAARVLLESGFVNVVDLGPMSAW